LPDRPVVAGLARAGGGIQKSAEYYHYVQQVSVRFFQA